MGYLQINEDFKTAIHNIITGPTLGYHSGNIKNLPIGLFVQNNIIVEILKKLGIWEKIIEYVLEKGGFNLALTVAWSPFVILFLNVGTSLIGIRDSVDKSYFEKHWDISEMYPQIEKWCKANDGLLITDDNVEDYDSGSLKKIGDTTHRLGFAKTNLANPNKFKEKLNTALTCIPIESKNGYYYVYPIFDTNDIYDIKVLCCKKNNELELYAKSLKEWKRINHEQFKK